MNSLMQQQNQSTATINRLLVALAQASKVDVKDLAKYFVDSSGGQKYADELNSAIDAEFARLNSKQTPVKEEMTTENEESGQGEVVGTANS